MIPYPHAANRHQEINARMLVREGGAEILLQEDLSGGGLAKLLMKYMDDEKALAKMGERARKVGRLDAAKVIVDQLEEMMGVG